MKKMNKKFNDLSSKTSLATLSLSVKLLDAWGPGCSLLFYEPKEPVDFKKVDLKELRKKLKE